MRYLKTYENFEGSESTEAPKEEAPKKENPAEVAAKVAEIVKLATGKVVTADQVQNQVESSEGQKNESVMDMFNHLVDMTQQTTWSQETGSTPTLSAVGAFLALGVSGVVAAGSALFAGLGLKKLGNKIIGSFKSVGSVDKFTQIDFEQEVTNYAKKNNIDLSQMNPDSEEGKKHLAAMLKSLQSK